MDLDLDNLLKTYRGSILYEGVPEYLYHYTDPHGMLGIVKNKKMWLSHARYSNDTNELNASRDIVHTQVKKHLDKLVPDLENSGMSLSLQYAREFLLKVQHYVDTKAAIKDVYIGCFCENPDLLSQWRGYSSGSGFCVGFLSKNLLQAAKSKFKAADIYFTRVNYRDDRWSEGIDLILGSITHEVLSNTNLNKNKLESAAEVCSQLVAKEILITAPFLKHPGFTEEQEWRLAIVCDSHEFEPSIRVSSVGLLPYLEIDTTNAVKEIVVGPSVDLELTHHALSLLTNNLGIKLSSSIVPLR